MQQSQKHLLHRCSDNSSWFCAFPGSLSTGLRTGYLFYIDVLCPSPGLPLEFPHSWLSSASIVEFIWLPHRPFLSLSGFTCGPFFPTALSKCQHSRIYWITITCQTPLWPDYVWKSKFKYNRAPTLWEIYLFLEHKMCNMAELRRCLYKSIQIIKLVQDSNVHPSEAPRNIHF